MLRALASTVAAAAMAAAAFAEGPAPSPAQVESDILHAANGFRADNGLAALAPNPMLADEARRFVAYLASTGRFSKRPVEAR